MILYRFSALEGLKRFSALEGFRFSYLVWICDLLSFSGSSLRYQYKFKALHWILNLETIFYLNFLLSCFISGILCFHLWHLRKKCVCIDSRSSYRLIRNKKRKIRGQGKTRLIRFLFVSYHRLQSCLNQISYHMVFYLHPNFYLLICSV